MKIWIYALLIAFIASGGLVYHGSTTEAPAEPIPTADTAQAHYLCLHYAATSAYKITCL